MAKFQNKKNNGICEVFSLDNIEKLRKNPNYIELDLKNKDDKKNKSSKKEENESGANENTLSND